MRLRLWFVGILLVGSLGPNSALAADASHPVTFTRDIAPIVFQHCASCHHKGGIGPFPLMSYDDVRKHRTQIVTVTARRYMPPWPPEPGFGHFADERRLSDAQIAILARWVQAGAPEGDARESPVPPRFNSEWQMGTPDLVVRMSQPYRIPADGRDVFRNFVIATGLKTARYVRGLELRMDNTRVVHHANVVLDHNASLRSRDGLDGQPGFPGMDVTTEASADSFDPDSHFLFWKPGTVQHLGPEAMSWRLDPATDLIVNLHLQPTGKPETIQAEIGLYFSKTPPTKFPILVQLEDDGRIDIPPASTTSTVSDQLTLPVTSELLAIYPHAHYLGKLIEAWAVLPDGNKQWLIRIPDWDINWQAVYEYAKPVLLPKGTVVHMRVCYDNSGANPRNPHSPPVRVRTGNRSEDEMGHVWLQLLPVTPAAGGSNHDERLTIQEAIMRRRLEKYPADFLAHYNLASSLQMRGRLSEAIEAYTAALRAQPDSVTAHNSLGSALFANDEIPQAVSQFNEALRLDPGYLNARYNLARAEAVSGDLDASAESYAVFLQQRPDDAAAQAGLGTICFKQQHFSEAQRHFERAAALNPNDADVQANLGTLLAIAGNLEGAIQAYEKALAIDPNHQAARANLQRAKAELSARQH